MKLSGDLVQKKWEEDKNKMRNFDILQSQTGKVYLSIYEDKPSNLSYWFTS